jgi:hypothetical protein
LSQHALNTGNQGDLGVFAANQRSRRNREGQVIQRYEVLQELPM